MRYLQGGVSSCRGDPNRCDGLGVQAFWRFLFRYFSFARFLAEHVINGLLLGSLDVDQCMYVIIIV